MHAVSSTGTGVGSSVGVAVGGGSVGSSVGVGGSVGSSVGVGGWVGSSVGVGGAAETSVGSGGSVGTTVGSPPHPASSNTSTNNRPSSTPALLPLTKNVVVLSIRDSPNLCSRSAAGTASRRSAPAYLASPLTQDKQAGGRSTGLHPPDLQRTYEGYAALRRRRYRPAAAVSVPKPTRIPSIGKAMPPVSGRGVGAGVSVTGASTAVPSSG
jgi:hypothetical protein